MRKPVKCVKMFAVALLGMMIFGNSLTAQAADDGRLEAIGGLSASYMYTTYIAIGAIGDGYGKDVYKAPQVQNLMGGFVGSLDAVKKQLIKVQKNAPNVSDKKYIDEILIIFGLLQEEARQLSNYTKTGKDADLAAYNKARTTVWPKIQKLLGLDKK